MAHPLEQLRDDALREIESAGDEQALEAARVKYLGRSGSVSAWGEQMKSLSKDEKPVVGKLLNEVRNAVTAASAVVVSAANAANNRETVGSDATVPNSMCWARMAATSARQSPPRATAIATSSSTLPGS